MADPTGKSIIFESIQKLPDQVADAWEQMQSVKIPEDCRLCHNVVISGMGGSALGGRIIDSLFSQKARVPIEIFTEFRLPNYVGRDTLLILSSYSGNTEETLSCAKDGQARGASIFGITTDGKLRSWLNENAKASFIFDPKFNPSNQPRMGLGYSLATILCVLSRCGFVDIKDEDVLEAVKYLREKQKDCPAKGYSQRLLGKIPVIVASGHLVGVAHAIKNQLNENAKTFATLFDIPELNHHLMEGLGLPKELKGLLSFLFIESDMYLDEVKKRYPLTKEVVTKQEMEVNSYKPIAQTMLSQILETLLFGELLAYHLAELQNVDPLPIPWVDYFKSKLV